jgi:hypothetical protein
VRRLLLLIAVEFLGLAGGAACGTPPDIPSGTWSFVGDGGEYALAAEAGDCTFKFGLPSGAHDFLVAVRCQRWPSSPSTMLQTSFEGGESFLFSASQAGQSVQATVARSELKIWLHDFTSLDQMTVSVGGQPPPELVFSLAGTSKAVSSLAEAITSAAIAGLPQPFSTVQQIAMIGTEAPEQPIQATTASDSVPESPADSPPADVLRSTGAQATSGAGATPQTTPAPTAVAPPPSGGVSSSSDAPAPTVTAPVPPPPAQQSPAAVAQGAPAEDQTNSLPISVDDLILDGGQMMGKVVSVSGQATCLNGTSCSLYDDANRNFVEFGGSIPRADRALLLQCDMLGNPCGVILTGTILPYYDGSPAIMVRSIQWVVKPHS